MQAPIFVSRPKCIKNGNIVNEILYGAEMSVLQFTKEKSPERCSEDFEVYLEL
jgi:hypothetical protein